MKEITETNPYGAGRPLAEIDWNLFEQFMKLSATQNELCNFFNIDVTTLRKHIKKRYGEHVDFPQISKRFSGERNISLRRMRFNHAKKNWQACQELCARYLDEPPLVISDPKNIQNINVITHADLASGAEISSPELSEKSDKGSE